MTTRAADLVMASERTPQVLREALRKRPPAFLIGNVVRYYAVGTDQEVWDETKDFPNVAPPFPTYWMEWPFPTKMISEERGVVDYSWAAGWQVGALVISYELEKYEGEAPHGHYRFLEFDTPTGRQKTAWGTLDSRWLSIAYMFTIDDKGGVCSQGGLLWMAAADGSFRGEVIAETGEQTGMSAIVDRDLVTAASAIDLETPEGRRDYMRGFHALIHPVLLAVSFLHCKNVVRQPVRGVSNPRRKQKTNRHKIPSAGMRYHTLEIAPLKQILRREGGMKGEGTGIKHAMHICRGHFRHYDEKGMFGNEKLKGSFWTPSHVRGTASRGLVVKDYKIGEVSESARATSPDGAAPPSTSS